LIEALNWVGHDDFTVTSLTTGASVTASTNRNSGWLVGAGIEWAFWPNWSAKVEYNYLGLVIGHLLFLLGRLPPYIYSSPATPSPRAIETSRW
jgi:outer membrane immunogenic protein